MKFQINRALGIFIGLLVSVSSILAQSDEVYIDKSYNNLEWVDFVNKVENNFHIKFYYEDSVLNSLRVNINNDLLLKQVLWENLRPLKLSFVFENENIFITKGTAVSTELPKGFFDVSLRGADDILDDRSKESNIQEYLSTRKALLSRNIVVGNRKDGAGKETVIIDGFIKNTEDGLPIIGASLYFEETETGTTTNERGYFSISLKKGKYSLNVNSIESKEEKYQLEVLSDGRIEIF